MRTYPQKLQSILRAKDRPEIIRTVKSLLDMFYKAIRKKKRRSS